MSNYMRDLTRVVLLSSDALQIDIQRIELLRKVKNEFYSKLNQSDFVKLYRIESGA
jgi:hypothetical protein